MNIKDKLKVIVENALASACKDGKLGPLTEPPALVAIEKPRLPEHGDLACGVALKLASHARMSPLKIAEVLAGYLEADGCSDKQKISNFAVASPGFINFKLSTGWLEESLSTIHKAKEKFGQAELGKGKRVLIEYVSANPTGELHIGHGRGAVFGSCLANLLAFAGYKVEQEFYINDTGEQIAQLGRCAFALYQKQLGKDVEYPQDGYPEYSLAEFISKIVATHKDAFLNLSAEEGAQKVGRLTADVILADQKQLLANLGVNFDNWFSELTLHSGKVQEALDKLNKNGYTYESEGALWLKAKELGDERDRVLRKSAGNTTYLANDAAYHLDKYNRGYDWLLTIWGADHHGQVPGLKAVCTALGEDASKMEIILTQIVNLNRDGQIVRMSKRMGTVVTLSEVMEEVGADAVRYYLAESNPQNPINFDLELAKKTSKENPAFYIQYAHARCCAILRRALEPYVNQETGKTEDPPLTQKQFDEFLKEYEVNPSVFAKAFDRDSDVFTHQKDLVMRLEAFPEEIIEATQNRQPGRLARYAYEVANDLQKFYEVSRVITDDLETTKARLGIIVATKQVLSNVLSVIGVSAPERM